MRDWTADELKSMAERLRRARIEAGYERASDAARKFGWSYSRYMNYENGERAVPPKQAVLFASAYGVTVDYIYFGKRDNSNQLDGTQALLSRMVRRIPLVALDNMSDFDRIAEGEHPDSPTVPVANFDSIPEKAIFVEINDKSMSNPREEFSFEPGDKVLIDLDANPTPADFVLALVPEEKTALFRLYREIGRAEDGSIIADLVPLNPNFRTLRISNASEGRIIGVCCSIHRIVDLKPAKAASNQKPLRAATLSASPRSLGRAVK